MAWLLADKLNIGLLALSQLHSDPYHWLEAGLLAAGLLGIYNNSGTPFWLAEKGTLRNPNISDTPIWAVEVLGLCGFDYVLASVFR